MRKNNCEEIRRELDELMLEETASSSAVAHLKECSACREFHETHTKLRRMVGSLGTVAAPADFDFRLRARLASDSGNGAFHFWPLVQKGFAVAAVVIVFAFGVVVVRNFVNQQKEEVVTSQPAVQQTPQQIQTTQANTRPAAQDLTALAPPDSPQRIRSERLPQIGPKTMRQLSTKDSSKEIAPVLGPEAFTSEVGAVFPIDASLQPLRLSLDDGRGNPKTISVPTIRFGSQQMLPTRNQLAEKGVW